MAAGLKEVGGERAAKAPLDHAAPRGATIGIPGASQPVLIEWPYATALVAVHALALLAFVPWFFS